MDPNHDCVVRNALAALNNPSSTEDVIQFAALSVLNLCHNSEDGFHHRQTHAAKVGVVDALVSNLCRTTLSESTQILCFRTLGVMAFNNSYVCGVIGSSVQLISRVQAILYDERATLEFKEEALYPLKNAAGDQWLIHPALLPLVSPILETLSCLSDIPQHSAIRTQLASFLCVLSYNAECRPSLLKAGVADHMRILLAARDKVGEASFPLSAALCAVCLLGDADDDGGLLDECCSPRVAVHILGALEAASLGRDYPLHSGTYFVAWKIMMAIASLCRWAKYRQMLQSSGRLGLMQAISTAMEESRDGRMTQHGLQALWHLSSDGGNN